MKTKTSYSLELVLKSIFLLDSKVFIKMLYFVIWKKNIYDDFDEYRLLVPALYKMSSYHVLAKCMRLLSSVYVEHIKNWISFVIFLWKGMKTMKTMKNKFYNKSHYKMDCCGGIDIIVNIIVLCFMGNLVGLKDWIFNLWLFFI